MQKFGCPLLGTSCFCLSLENSFVESVFNLSSVSVQEVQVFNYVWLRICRLRCWECALLAFLWHVLYSLFPFQCDRNWCWLSMCWNKEFSFFREKVDNQSCWGLRSLVIWQNHGVKWNTQPRAPLFSFLSVHPIFIRKRDFLPLLLNMRKSFHGRKFCFAFLNWSVTFIQLIISLHHFKVNVQCGHKCLNWGPQFFNVCVMLNV